MKVSTAIVLLALAPTPALHAADSPSGTAAGQLSQQDMDRHMARMQQDVELMQQQMARMRDAQDPEARRRLMSEHYETMHSHMRTMHAMQGTMGGHHGGMMGGGMMGGGMMGGHRGGMMDGHRGGMMGGAPGGDQAPSPMMAECMEMMQRQQRPPGAPDRR